MALKAQNSIFYLNLIKIVILAFSLWLFLIKKSDSPLLRSTSRRGGADFAVSHMSDAGIHY